MERVQRSSPPDRFVPHLILGIAAEATADEARLAYLEAVRRSPPDKDPQQFAELRRAMQAYDAPFAAAEEVFRESFEPPSLAAVVDEAKTRPPRLPTSLLLALGDQPEVASG